MEDKNAILDLPWMLWNCQTFALIVQSMVRRHPENPGILKALTLTVSDVPENSVKHAA